MKFNYAEIRVLEESLEKLISKEVPIRTAYKLGNISKVIAGKLSILETQRINLVKKYSKKEDEDGDFEVIEEKEEEFKKEFSELLMKEIEVDCKPISIPELGDISLTTIDLLKLDKLICDN